MPNGGAEVTGWLPFKERPIDVLYMGSCNKEITDVPPIQFLEDGGRELYNTVIANMINNPSLVTENAIEDYFKEHNILVSDQQLYQLNLSAAMFIEENIRHHFKQKTLYHLSQAGIRTEIYGDNWEGKFPLHPNIKIHKRISSEECNILAGQSKICLNCMPWYKEGCSERVFNTMLNASVSVSDTSSYLKENFEYGQDIVFYELDNIEQMICDILYILENPDVGEVIAMNGYLKAKMYHSWKKRMEAIIGFYEVDIKHI